MVIRLGMMQHTITGWLPQLYYVHSIRLDITQVFGVELTLKNPQGLAKPGMPADSSILVPAAPEAQRSSL